MEWIAGGLIAVILFPIVIWVSTVTLPVMIMKLAEAQYRSHRTSLATSLFQLALGLARATDWMFPKNLLPRQTTPLAITLQACSVHHYLLGQYERSSALDDERLSLLEDSSDLSGLATATMNSAVHSMLRGDLTRALQLSERGIPIIENAYSNSIKNESSAMDKAMSKVHAANLGSAMFARAWILEVLRRYNEAQPIRERILSIMEEDSGADSFAVTPHLSQLGSLYRKQKRYSDAEPLLRRCLSVRKNIRDNPQADTADKELCTDLQIAAAHEELGNLLLDNGNISEAAEHLDTAQSIVDREVSPDNPMHAEIAITVAQLRTAQTRYEEAELLLVNALSALEIKLGKGNPMLLPCLESLSSLYHKNGATVDATTTDARIKQICKRWDIPSKDDEDTK